MLCSTYNVIQDSLTGQILIVEIQRDRSVDDQLDSFNLATPDPIFKIQKYNTFIFLSEKRPYSSRLRVAICQAQKNEC